MRLLGHALFFVTAAGCAQAPLPPAPAQLKVTTPQTRAYELRRKIAGVGDVTEHVISRAPVRAREHGLCAGRIDLQVPNAPGGPQSYQAEVGCPDGSSRVRAFHTDAKGRHWAYLPTLDQMMRARSLVLADRTDGVAWAVNGFVYQSTSWTAVLHASGHAHGDAEALVPSEGGTRVRNLVVYLGTNLGTPAPRAQWDDLHIALVDENGGLLARLVMDTSSMTSHSGIMVRRQDRAIRLVEYVGLLRDASGAWRFVDLSLPVRSTPAAPASGAAAAWERVMETHGTQLLSLDDDAPTGHLWVDGREWLSVDRIAGISDDVTHRAPSTSGGNTLAVIPAHENDPAFLLAHAPSETALISFDRTIAGDAFGLLPRLPPKARAGWSHVRDRIGKDGKRAAQTAEIEVLNGPYTSRTLRFELLGGRTMHVVRQLVGVRGANGLEFGLRQFVDVDR